MQKRDVESLFDVLGPLLGCLETLKHIARYLHPPALTGILEDIGRPDDELRARLRAMTTAEGPPGAVAMRRVLADSSQAALHAFEGLREAPGLAEGPLHAYRALRQLARAQEALYPLATVLPPVSRFFLDAEGRADEGFQERLVAAGAPDGTGLMWTGQDPDGRADAWIYVPEYYTPEREWPLVFALHGGSGTGRYFIWSWLRAARSRGAILIAPTALERTWAIMGEDQDSPNLARMVDFARAQWRVDPTRLLLTGMSDGGTFAYTSGLAAGSPFTHLAPVAAAFHPMLTMMADAGRLKGLPIHVAHGALDWMFDVQNARDAARTLAAAGAAVAYREIPDLSHTYPIELSGPILDWMRENAGA